MDKLPIEYQEFWRKWNVFDGKSTVREFWMVVLVNFIIAIVLGIIVAIIKMPILSSLWGLAIIIPQWAIMIRRFHDTGRSGWYWLWGLIPLVGWIIVLIALVQPSK